MKTFKLTYTTTANVSTFGIIDATSLIAAIELFETIGNKYALTSVEDVTGKFVDLDGTVK